MSVFLLLVLLKLLNETEMLTASVLNIDQKQSQSSNITVCSGFSAW